MENGNNSQFNQHVLSVEAGVEGPLSDIFREDAIVSAYPCLRHAKSVQLCGLRTLNMADSLAEYVRNGVIGTVILRIRAEWWSAAGDENSVQGTPYIDIEDIVQKVEEENADDVADVNATKIVKADSRISNADLLIANSDTNKKDEQFKFNDAGFVPWSESIAYPSVSRVFNLPQNTLSWDNAGVRRWLAWLLNVYGKFDNVNLSVLELFDGRQLCNISHMQFEHEIGADKHDRLWQHIQLFRHGLVIAVAPEVHTGLIQSRADPPTATKNSVAVLSPHNKISSKKLHGVSHNSSPPKLTIRLLPPRDANSETLGTAMPMNMRASNFTIENDGVPLNAHRNRQKTKKLKSKFSAGKSVDIHGRLTGNRRVKTSLNIPFEYVDDEEAAHLPPIFPAVVSNVIGTPLMSPPAHLVTQHLQASLSCMQQQSVAESSAPSAVVSEGVSRRSQRSNTLSLSLSLSHDSSNSSGAGGSGNGSGNGIDRFPDNLSTFRMIDDLNSMQPVPKVDAQQLNLPADETSWQYSAALFSKCMFGRFGPQTQVWQFLLGYLTSPPLEHAQAPLLSWLGDDGTFVLNDAEKVASYYGKIIHKRDMSYERLSRKFRYHYTGEYPLLAKNSSSSKIRSFTYQISGDIAIGIGFTLEELRRIACGEMSPPKIIPDIPACQNPMIYAAARSLPMNDYREQLTLLGADAENPASLHKLPFDVVKVSTETLKRALAQTIRTPASSVKSGSTSAGRRKSSVTSSNVSSTKKNNGRSGKKRQIKRKKKRPTPKAVM